MKLVIGYFYPKLLNLYGDNGNVEILVSRAKRRNIEVEVVEITPDFRFNEDVLRRLNIVFMGGGPDSSQKGMYEDLVKNKGDYLRDYVENDGLGLYICGAYQLMGNYYKASDGKILDGLGIFNLHTQHFGNHKPRCIGNVVSEIDSSLRHVIPFNVNNKIGNTLVGFENHGGRTYLSDEVLPFAKVKKGFGNNGEDATEGALYKSSIGTYLHGPILSKNPHLADYLIASALGLDTLSALEDNFIIDAHQAALNLG